VERLKEKEEIKEDKRISGAEAMYCNVLLGRLFRQTISPMKHCNCSFSRDGFGEVDPIEIRHLNIQENEISCCFFYKFRKIYDKR